MKISKLLVLTALWLGMGTSAMAEVPDGVWTMPEPTGLEVVANPAFDGTHYVLYNPAAKLFFASGNEWSTRASVASFGYEVWFTSKEESGSPAEPRVAPEGSYFFNDDCQHPDRKEGLKDLFTDGGGATWVDRAPGNASQTDFYWSVTKVGDFYRIQNVPFAAREGNAGKFIGWKGGSDSRLYMILPEEGTVDWQFVTVDSYNQFTYGDAYQEYETAANTYFSGVALEASLKEAEELGINIAEWLAVYTNTASTKEELDAAKTAVDAVVSAKKTLQKLVDAGAELNAPIEDAQALLTNADATADELKAANDKLNPIVEARKSLKKALDDAKAAGFEATADYDAVYNDKASTEAQLKKALEDLNAAVVAWGENHATWDKPADFTAKIVNPTFDNADCKTGWSGTEFGRGGTVADGAEHYSKNYDTYQKITGLSAGIYAVGVNGFYRSGNYNGDAEKHWLAKDDASKYAKLYAKVGENTFETPVANVLSGVQAENQNVGDVAVTLQDEEGNDTIVYAPNTMKAGDHYFHNLNQYANKLYVAVNEGDTLTIGVKKTTQIGGDWSLFDDFSLTYYGTGADACQNYVNEAMKNFSEYVIEEGTLYTKAYLDAYEKAYTGEKTASSMAEVEAIIGGINKAKEDLDKNIELWKTWSETLEKAYKLYTVDENYQSLIATGVLSDYYEMDENEEGGPGKETILENMNLTNEQLQVEIERVNKYEADILDEFKNGLKPGTDVTNLLKNPDFESGVHRGVANPSGLSGDYGTADGWNADKFASGNFTPGPDGKDNDPTVNHAFEAWHCHDFDLWQEVKDVPEGVYVIEVQGYVRNETAGTVTEYDPSIIPIKLYMNKSTSNFPDVFSEEVADEHYVDGELPKIEDWSWSGAIANYPNSMGAAGLCFDWGMYKVSTFGLVKAGDPMRIGVKGKMNNDWWCIWDNFKLTYQGYEVSYVEPALDQALTQISTEKPMSKTLYAQASSLNSRAAEAKATGDGKTMFQMLSEITDVADAITTSVALFEELAYAVSDENPSGIYAKTLESDNKAAVAEAQSLCDEINNGIENHQYEDADVPGLMERIAKMITKLGYPEGWETASDNNPKDFTGVIVNPDYEIDNNGWSGTTASRNSDACNVEIFGSNFDYYQDILDLPAGTYQLTVQGFYRAGGAEADYKAFTENPEMLNHAFIYAMTSLNGDTAIASKPMKRLAAEATSEYDLGYLPEGYVYAAAETEEGAGDGWIVCNTMGTASDEFYNDKYLNENVTFKLAEGAKLRIGLKKEVNIENNWTIWDNWHLTYFGKESSLTPDGDASGIETVNQATTMKIEYFTIDGRKATRAQKGILIQKMTLGNGSVIVRKIQK